MDNKQLKKEDAKRIATKEEYEMYWISHRYKIPLDDIAEAVKAVGHMRKKVYKYLRGKGFKIGTLSPQEMWDLETEAANKKKKKK